MAEYHPLRGRDHESTSTSHAKLNAIAEIRAKNCTSAKMPDLSHLKLSDYENVYEPSDDTYLLIDAIGVDIDDVVDEGQRGGMGDESLGGWEGGGKNYVHRCYDRHHGRIKGRKIEITTLEIGCGTGVPTVYLGKRLRDISSCAITHHVTDINPDAIRIAKCTAKANGLPEFDVRARLCDLASELLDELRNGVDVLIFNPPYVPTPNDEVGSDGIEASWAGGFNGRVVLDRALPQIAHLLSYPHGVAYVVVVDDNYPEEICRIMNERYGILVTPWLRRRARNEYLTILKMTTTREYISDSDDMVNKHEHESHE
jgi:release factor glutamine methyltransferase